VRSYIATSAERETFERNVGVSNCIKHAPRRTEIGTSILDTGYGLIMVLSWRAYGELTFCGIDDKYFHNLRCEHTCPGTNIEYS
jgi:hypothetical protein